MLAFLFIWIKSEIIAKIFMTLKFENLVVVPYTCGWERKIMMIIFYKSVMWLMQVLAKLLNMFIKLPSGVKLLKNVKYGELYKQKFDIYYNHRKKVKSIMFFVHGGGFISGDKLFYKGFCGKLSSMGYMVININYALAPKRGLRNMVNDVVCAVEKSIDTIKAKNFCKKLIFSGDSAGTMIIFKAYEKLKSSGKLLVYKIGLIGVYGVYNLEWFNESLFPYKDLFIKSIDTDIKFDNCLALTKKSDGEPILLVSGEVDKLHKNQTVPIINEYTKLGYNVNSFILDKSFSFGFHGFLAYRNNKATKLMPEIVDKFIETSV